MAEGEIHKYLKIQGMKFLKTKCTDLVATEVVYRNMYSIADVAAINLKRKEIRIIECKATRQDFLRDKKLLDIDKSYYRVMVFFRVDLPVIGNLTTFRIKGETESIYYAKDESALRTCS